MDLEIRHARIVVTIDEMGSISQAATVLGLPQPSLSASLKRVEKVMGGRLFERTTSGVRATILGQCVIPRLTELVRRCDELSALTTRWESDAFRIADVDGTPPLLQKAIQLSLHEGTLRTVTLSRSAAVHAVQDGDVPMALVPTVPEVDPVRFSRTRLAAEVVISERIGLALREDHLFATCESVTKSQVAQIAFVRQLPEHWLHRTEQLILQQMDVPETEALHLVGGLGEAIGWVRDCDMAAFAPPIAAGLGVRMVAVPDAPRNEMVLIWNRRLVAARLAHRIMDTIRAYDLARRHADIGISGCS